MRQLVINCAVFNVVDSNVQHTYTVGGAITAMENIPEEYLIEQSIPIEAKEESLPEGPQPLTAKQKSQLQMKKPTTSKTPWR